MKANTLEEKPAQEDVKHKEPRPFFYYPRHKKNNKSRQVVAGCVVEDKLYLGVAQCFSGHPKRTNPEKNTWEESVKADQFTKKNGRVIAVGRALRGCEDCFKKKLRHVIEIPEETLKSGALGKFFVAEVEKRFKPMVRKPKTGEKKSSYVAHPEAV